MQGLNDYQDAHKLVDQRLKQYSHDLKNTEERINSRNKLIS